MTIRALLLVVTILWGGSAHALKVVCPTSTVRALMNAGFDPLESVEVCGNYVECNLNETKEAFARAGYSSEKTEKICRPYHHALSRISSSEREKALREWSWVLKKDKPREFVCPVEVVKALMKTGHRPLAAVDLCTDFFVCYKPGSVLKKLYPTARFERICQDPSSAFSQIPEEKKRLLDSFARSSHDDSSGKSGNSQTVKKAE